MIDMTDINALLVEGMTLLGDWEHPEDQPCRCCGIREPRTEWGDVLVLCAACAAVAEGRAYYVNPVEGLSERQRDLLVGYQGSHLPMSSGLVFVPPQIQMSDVIGRKGTNELRTEMLMSNQAEQAFEDEVRSHEAHINRSCPYCGNVQILDSKGVCINCKINKK
jgi:hypothetical protein